MWQSRVEIKGYSVMYFNRIAAFEAPSLTEVQQYGALKAAM